jgi:hypothetical protein
MMGASAFDEGDDRQPYGASLQIPEICAAKQDVVIVYMAVSSALDCAHIYGNQCVGIIAEFVSFTFQQEIFPATG